MDVKDFYRVVLPEQGMYALFSGTLKQHRWTDSRDKLATATAIINKSEPNWYYATGTFSERKRTQECSLYKRCFYIDIDAGPAKYEKRPSDAYPSRKEAVQALVDFVRETKLVPTYVVASGTYGLYAYWALDEDCTLDEWQPVAAALKALTVEKGLKADRTVTADAARILRPLGSVRDDGAVVKVLQDTGHIWTLEDFRGKVGEIAPAFPTVTRKFGGRDVYGEAGMDSLVSGPPKSLLRAAEKCATLHWIGQMRGDVPYAPWWNMIGVAKHCEDGEDLVHDFSSGHEAYDADEVVRKMESWSTGPATCAQFRDGENRCEGCTHSVTSPIQLGAIPREELPQERQDELRSEEQARVDAVQEAVEAAQPEAPWKGKIKTDDFLIKPLANGKLAIHGKVDIPDKNNPGATTSVFIPVTTDICWLDEWAEASHGSEAMVSLCKVTTTGRVAAFELEQSLMADPSALLKKLGGWGVHTLPGTKSKILMVDYVKAQLDRIRKDGLRPKIAGHFGLRVLDDGNLASACGRVMFMADGSIKRGLVAEALRSLADEVYQVKLPTDNRHWGPEVWTDHIEPGARKFADFARRMFEGMPKHQLAIQMGIASPLMPFTATSPIDGDRLPPCGLTVSLYSRASGRMKSSANQLVALAYGRPEVRDGNDNASTAIARISKLSLAGTMPVVFDEMGNSTPQVVATLVSSIANGSGRERATRTGGLIAAETWSLVALMSSNTPIRDMITASHSETAAIQMRALELDVDSTPPASAESQRIYREESQRLNGEIAGHYGAIVQREICMMGVERVTQLVQECVSEASSWVDDEQQARFQWRAMGAALALHRIMDRLGLALFDIEKIKTEFIIAAQLTVEQIEETVAPDNFARLMADFLHESMPYTLATDKRNASIGRDAQHVTVLNSSGVPREVRVRRVQDVGVAYIHAGEWRKWVSDRRLGFSTIRDGSRSFLMESGQEPMHRNKTNKGARNERLIHRLDLLAGLRERSGVPVRAYCVDLKALYEELGGDDDSPEWVRMDGNVADMEEARRAENLVSSGTQ